MEVFDDRLEITSPGGMMNGRRVQDMDIRHIPSMRRNQVISDVFSRLGFMERRGSGIDRILNSYVEVAQKPTFYSDSDFFIVTLPNRSVATPAQVSMESVASDSEKVSTLMQAEAKRDKEIADFSKFAHFLHTGRKAVFFLALHPTSDSLLGIEDDAFSHPNVRRMIAHNASKMTEEEIGMEKPFRMPSLIRVTIARSLRQYLHGCRPPVARSPAGKRPDPD